MHGKWFILVVTDVTKKLLIKTIKLWRNVPWSIVYIIQWAGYYGPMSLLHPLTTLLAGRLCATLCRLFVSTCCLEFFWGGISVLHTKQLMFESYNDISMYSGPQLFTLWFSGEAVQVQGSLMHVCLWEFWSFAMHEWAMPGPSCHS